MAKRSDRNGGGVRENVPAADEPELDDIYSVEYLAEVAGGNAREERLAELKRRIELGAYKPAAESIAADMLARVGLGSDEE
ncbi:MAG: flagellar biosynthesis anti-sigma factor FlgM [Myxococcota bacterium]